MGFSAQTALCRYRYDALDRLTASAPKTHTQVQRFYQKNRLAIEIQGDVQRRLVQHEAVLLAQKQRAQGEASTNMLATDQHRSVLQRLLGTGLESLAYTPYGHHPVESDQTFVPGFNGEPCDPVTGHYLLGNGYRAFNPVLMRFNSPDSLSPFDEGGLNAYAYCQGDPVNFDDPTGHINVALYRKAQTNAARSSVIVPNPARASVIALNPQSRAIQRDRASPTPALVSTPSAVDQVGSGPSSTSAPALPQPSSPMPVAASSSGRRTSNGSVNPDILSPDTLRRYRGVLYSDMSSKMPPTPETLTLAQHRFEYRINAGHLLIRHYQAKLAAEGRNRKYDNAVLRGLHTARIKTAVNERGYRALMSNVKAARQPN